MERGAFVELGVRQRQQHELPRVQLEILREETGIEFGAEGHQLGFDALQTRRGAQRRQHFRDQALRDWRLREPRGDEQSPDQPFVIFQDVKAVAGGLPFSIAT